MILISYKLKFLTSSESSAENAPLERAATGLATRGIGSAGTCRWKGNSQRSHRRMKNGFETTYKPISTPSGILPWKLISQRLPCLVIAVVSCAQCSWPWRNLQHLLQQLSVCIRSWVGKRTISQTDARTISFGCHVICRFDRRPFRKDHPRSRYHERHSMLRVDLAVQVR